MQAYRNSLAITERLAAKDPGRADWQMDLAAGYQRLWFLYESIGIDKSRQQYRKKLLETLRYMGQSGMLMDPQLKSLLEEMEKEEPKTEIPPVKPKPVYSPEGKRLCPVCGLEARGSFCKWCKSPL
jgi:hypothetical protein